MKNAIHQSGIVNDICLFRISNKKLLLLILVIFDLQITTSSEKDNKDTVSLVFGEDKWNDLATLTG